MTVIPDMNIDRRRLMAAAATLAALSTRAASALAATATATDVTAIDIALQPDAVMVRRAKAANAALLKNFPKGFALDATHNPHVSMLQQFVHTADLEKVYAAAGKVFSTVDARKWKLEAYKYYFIPSPPVGLAGIVARVTPELLSLQQKLIAAVAPFTANKQGTKAAFYSDVEGRDIQDFLLEYVADFVKIAAGPKFNPHVTTGVGTEAYLKKLLAEPFDAFTFSPVGASVFHLGSFGTARKELKALKLKG
jgi:hypothetical protein